MIRDLNNEDHTVGFCRGKNDKKHKPAGKVDLDPETMRVWNYLMENDRSGDSEEVDEEKEKRWREKWWRDERIKYNKWLEPFTERMRFILGNIIMSHIAIFGRNPIFQKEVFRIINYYLNLNNITELHFVAVSFKLTIHKFTLL